MSDQSRSAARENFAHQRAFLLLSTEPDSPPSSGLQEARIPAPDARRRDIVRRGLTGFVPASLQ